MDIPKRSLINYIVDIGLSISFLIVFVTGIFKWPALLPKLGISYRILPMRLFTILHDWSGLIMGILVFVHLGLHWRFMVGMTKRIFKKSTHAKKVE